MTKSLYETLGIKENASSSEIKRAYRELAKQYHPDINKSPDAEAKFKEINAAYEILSDPQKKAQYDEYGDQLFNGQSFSDFSRGRYEHEDISDLFNRIFGDRGGFNRDSSDFGGFGFGNFSGGGGIDLDVEAKIDIPLEKAILGGGVRVSVNDSAFELKIPEGICHGSKLRAKGKGRRLGSMAGDAIVTVHVNGKDGFEIDGLNLIQDIFVPLKTMLFGGEIEVKALQKDVTVKIPKNMQNGKKMRIPNITGFRDLKHGKKGNLMLRVFAKLPDSDKFSKELRDLLQKEL